jgi:hypothetical protein
MIGVQGQESRHSGDPMSLVRLGFVKDAGFSQIYSSNLFDERRLIHQQVCQRRNYFNSCKK